MDDLDGGFGRTCISCLSGDTDRLLSPLLSQLIMSFSATLVVGVGTGLRKVTFFPPSPDALTVLVRSLSPCDGSNISRPVTECGRRVVDGPASLRVSGVSSGLGDRKGTMDGASTGVW